MRRYITIMLMILLSTIVAQGQIRIGGNVYGGGNHAEVKGSTKVTVKAGDIGAVMDPNATRPLSDPQGKVFGGARMADVGGNTFVHIDGEHATDYILINQVYGGNDIAGKIGTAMTVGESKPTELTAVKAAEDPDPKKNVITNTFNSYVRISTKLTSPNVYYTAEEIAAATSGSPAYGKTTNHVKTAAVQDPDAKKIYIGQLFAGGNGDFEYPDEQVDGEYVIKQGETIIARSKSPFMRPELDSTYLEVLGGSIVYAYGGGNNATVKEQNIIHIDNSSAVVNHILVTDGTGAVDAGIEADAATYTDYVASVAAGTPVIPPGYEELLTAERFKEMGINTTFSFPSSGAFQIGRFFGGNNKAEMHIRPTWNLLAGKVRNLYSGGNKGSMTSPDGLLLEIMPYSTLIVDNLYGGCRMADVMPTNSEGVYAPCTNLPGYHFPDQLSARVLVKGGHINNVYGGNDVTGTVYGGNAVDINTTVYGDVYGGGNGAYPYTDSPSLKDDPTYGDFCYYDENSSGGTEGLKAFRPNAEQVSIHLSGTADDKTVIKGSVFVGGNCASLATKKSNPMVELKIGSHVIADKVFLGNNGEKMVDESILQHYANVYPGAEGFSSFNFKGDATTFADYMDGVAMPLKPSLVFENTANGDAATYIDNTSMIGSFFGGGNRGSMIVSGKTSLKFDRKLIIFDKIVAGCNNANVAEGPYNAAYEGGVLGAADERDSYTEGGKIKDRLQLDLDNVVIRPQRWNDTFTAVPNNTTLTAGKEYYETDLHETKFIANGTEVSTTANPYYELTTVGLSLEWNTAKWSLAENDFVSTGTSKTGSPKDCEDIDRRLLCGNVYGGCYTSGHVNGNVVININQDLMERDVIFAEPDPADPYKIKSEAERRTGVLREAQGDDVMASALAVYGGGYGEDTEIWGSTTINHNNGYAFQMYGGGEQGVVGKKNNEGEYVYNAAYSTTVNLKGINPGYSEKESGLPIPEAEYIYGGGNEGDVLGDSYVYLGNGRVYDAFGGASNADIYGGTEVHIGYNGGFPWIRDNVYGGNDFGGTIRGNINHYTATTRPVFDNELKRSSTYVKYMQGRVDSIFGGNYGYYDYADRIFKDYTNDDGTPKDGFNFPHLNDNSFVHFVPEDHSSNFVGLIFGGSEGFAGHERLSNSMQKDTYVLLDDTKTKDANRFANIDVYGGGAFAGVGSSLTTLGAGRTAIDLFAGSYHNIYGGCNREGLVGYTRVNVPAVSTAKVNALFGGGKGYDISLFAADKHPELAARFCDHYVTCIDFKSENAIVNDAIYGGNENCRVACDTYINIEAPVMQSSGYQANIYGAGYGQKTVSGRTNVFMNNGSNAYKVFGGGRDGNAFNFASLRSWLTDQYRTAAGDPAADVQDKVDAYGNTLNSFSDYLANNPISLPTNIGTYPDPSTGSYNGTYTNDILPTSGVDYHQTNVHIMNGGNVSGYAYGGGYGKDAVVAGTTYIELKGGNVDRDIYGGGEGGPVYDEFGLGGFTATTNVKIEGGMARNIYGGGYLGSVGMHHKTIDGELVESAIDVTDATEIPAVTNVTIGKIQKGSENLSFYNGVPAIQRNVYGGGEGGSVYGTTNLTINNGYVGYRYKNTATSGAAVYEYVEELDDQTPNAIELAGNAFGGGYVVNSYVDHANVTMFGGTLRGSLYGGGEVGPIGRGANKTSLGKGGLENGDATIFWAGTTQVTMYGGKVLRNVFGGGRGKDSWGGDGTMYMDKNVVESLKSDGLFCKGYVFGQTRVNIHGGEIGTDEGMLKGYGNVFGGGDEGTVYSAYMDNDKLYIGKKIGVRYDGSHEGYYFQYGPSDAVTPAYLTDGGRNIFTEDCKVVVEPHAQAKENLSITGGTGSPRGTGSYNAGEYVTTADLNRLKSKNNDSNWPKLDDFGIIIHNAVFAGGNIAAGSSSLFANATTVYGNATASIHDVYNRDLITIGTGHTGGLYGDGNLTFVDGYRELNITNYGTDYYHIKNQLEYDEYKVLPEREKAYYELKYKCLITCTDYEGTTYYAATAESEGSNLPMDELMALFTKPDGNSVLSTTGDSIIVTVAGKKVPNPSYWKENGVVSIYAGRIMNTIQRADFCGVFGSRMVMKGARDRVPEMVDYTNYTINRVREVSLNKKTSIAGDTGDNALHGNYFGIYSNVNYLGALTSDVLFSSPRTTNADTEQYPNLKPESEGQTFYQWKQAHKDDKTRNNGTCHNHLALASGVYLELTTEESTGPDLYEKVWGPITGVVELDLINVQTGVGGGFVYARNEHGKPGTGESNTTLTALNAGAASKWHYKYDNTFNNWEEAEANKEEWQTSGNFIHSSQTIIDDCYNVGSKYNGKYGNTAHEGTSAGVPAHYWFISGSVYVYDQYISAYTGSPNAYSETVELPITINAASHGTMTLMDVQPNLYAFYSTYTDASNNTPLSGDKKLVINDVTYKLNDPISYWDWNKLPASEKKLFVADTYVLKDSCYINSKYYPAGYVMLPSEYNSLKTYAEDHEIEGENVKAVKKATKNAEGEDVVEKDSKGLDVYVAFDDAFRSSNNMSHTTGYLLTYNVTNPNLWNKWYTKINSDTREKQQTDADGFEDGPTYHPTTTGLYGQQEYDKNAIISKFEYDKYNGYDANSNGSYTDIAEGDVYGLKQMFSDITKRTDQATFVPAYLVTKEYDDGTNHYYPGAPVSTSNGNTSPALVSTATIQLSSTEYIYVNDLMTEAQKTQLKTTYSSLADEIEACLKPAYICTTAGFYGGSYYETGNNYRALEAYSAMSPTDRKQFAFNYDALDLLIDPTYGGTAGRKYQYDSAAATSDGANSNAAHYSLATPIDYTATYKGESPMTYSDAGNNSHTIAVNQELTSTVYETLPNEQHHYAPITVDKAGDYYVVKESFVHGETPYAVGTTIDSGTYDRLTQSEKANYITILSFADEDVKLDGSSKPIPYYYCRESYTVNENGEGVAVSKYKNSIGTGNASYTKDSTDPVPVGYVISATNYNSLPNRQKNFTIHGVSPMETSTLYVARNADINDLSTEKIITVIYKYDYEESDKDGTHITPVSERHVVNIHITFKSGVPVVEDINPPTIVLPGTGITMRVPSVTPGAYEVTGGGWELFEKPSDAESHVNGVPYTPSEDPLYWYQDGFYLAYYAKTYLGKTYSNHVQVSVANYHDLKEVMDDKLNHLHVDYDRSRLKRDSKIYINDYSGDKDGLDIFKDFYDLSLLTNPTTNQETGLISGGTFDGHKPLNTHETNGVKGGQNLEFFLRTDISHTEPWSTIGTDEVCFKGNLHGDGHTISGLNNSLFYNLCGSVYNLGVTGSFNSAGVVDKGSGYVESCWTKTSNETALSTKPNAVFGNPTDTEGYQLVNSYFLVDNKDLYDNVSTDATTGITTSGDARGKATAMSAKAYYNGELAYNLNNFYLYKRYSDKQVTSGTENQKYSYFTIGSDGKLVLQNNHYYDAHADLCSTGHVDKNADVIMYVEDRFADGDYRYAAGEIPTSEDERLYTWTVTDQETGKETVESSFFPIYPDDYIFFGQKLTYGWAVAAHQEVPTAVTRNNGRLSQLSDANRVYRAPAYFRSKEMGVAHFNPDAYLAQKSNDGTKTAYPGMTAIDFAGHYDTDYILGQAYRNGQNWISEKNDKQQAFYPPLLDDDGLLSIINCDETRNLLVYAPAESAATGYANKATYDVLTDYFTDPDYSSYYSNPTTYRTVADATSTNGSIYGHLVMDGKIAKNDHLLVDKEDFNCPIAFQFDNKHRMWYQRKPEDHEYVDFTKGWQGISIPFTAELVTTNVKGEISHFYSGSEVSKNNTNTKIGHEYWLREFKDITVVEEGEPKVAKASFLYPEATGGNSKTVDNTFLWDYYYKNSTVHNQKDYNLDTYQTYYEKSRTYSSYPLLTAAVPYIVGFPGETYYEFDLSGNFQAQNTAVTIDKLGKQIISFVSDTGISIGVSDDETKDGVLHSKSGNGKDYSFTFKPSYMNMSLNAGTNNYTLDTAGDSYDKVPATGDATKVSAFRPYFIATSAANAGSRKMAPERILFGGDFEGLEGEPISTLDGDLEIYVKDHKVVTTSHLKEATTVRIISVSGVTMANYVLQPGETVETPIRVEGAYIVNKKKLLVK